MIFQHLWDLERRQGNQFAVFQEIITYSSLFFAELMAGLAMRLMAAPPDQSKSLKGLWRCHESCNQAIRPILQALQSSVHLVAHP